MRRDGSFEYWLGMMLPEDTNVPKGYDSFHVPAYTGIVNWVSRKEPDVYFHCCIKEMENMGYHWSQTKDGDRLMAERYVCPRFTQPDASGNRILDLVYFTDFDECDLHGSPMYIWM